MPSLTVSIPVYNKELFLSEAIESVLSQSFKDFELLLIDDCSTDRSLEIARAYANKDHRIRVVENSKNLGNIGNGNRCIDIANTDLIVRFDADDVMSPGRLDKQYNWMKSNPEYILLSGLNQNLETGEVLNMINDDEGMDFYFLFPFRTPLSQPCTIFRKSLMTAYEISYDENGPRIGEDWLLFFKASQKGKIGFHNEVVNQYRFHDDNISKARNKDYYQDVKYVMKYIFDSYKVNVLNEVSLLFFKRQMIKGEELNEKVLTDYKIMREDFIKNFVPSFEANRGEILKELDAIDEWLFLKSIYLKKLKVYKKVFGLKLNQYPQYFYHKNIKR